MCFSPKPVPQPSKTDELRALVRKNAHKAASGWTVWTFDDMSYENLKSYLEANGDAAAQKLAKKTDATRQELVKAANSAYASAASAGDAAYATVANYLAQTTDSVKASTFDAWSESDLKRYLDNFGIVRPDSLPP